MSFIALSLIGFGLAMDCFAVSIGIGFSHQKMPVKKMVLIALTFGIFHFIMPLLGWQLGHLFKGHIDKVDHWIAFFLLLFIGLKMMRDGFSKKEDTQFNTDKIMVLLGLGLATSIDAFIIGMPLAFLGFNVIVSVLVISFITFITSLSGFFIGQKMGCYSGNKAEIIGGLILIAIGIKVLYEHLF